MGTELNVLTLILEATLLVKLVMALLIIASVASWMVIFRKRQQLARAEKRADGFEERFWSGSDLQALYDRVNNDRDTDSGLENIFEAGFREFLKMRQHKRATEEAMVDSAARGMRIALTREVDRLEGSLSFLATVGSVSPYVGLFGTVWGIMHSFNALGNVNQATIAMVAPGISEALIATALGLFAAIPAVIAYNRFANQVERLETRYDNFKEEFSSILQRQAHYLIDQDS